MTQPMKTMLQALIIYCLEHQLSTKLLDEGQCRDTLESGTYTFMLKERFELYF